MTNVFEPVRVEGKLMAKCMETGSIQPEGFIRYIQLNTAEKNNQAIQVTETGRTIRIPMPSDYASPAKLSFRKHIESRDPETMFSNLTTLTQMVGKGIQPSLVVTGMAGMGKTYLVKKTLTDMGMMESKEFVHFKGRATAAGLFITTR
jgi:predicted ATP-dependent serine protease